jgi:hypothetical protein
MNQALIDVMNITGKSEALVSITATLDPSLWSSRKKSIIVGALTNGMASCGRETGRMVEELVEHCCHDTIPNINSGWYGGVLPEHIKPEKYEEFVAYTFAWIRMKKATEKTVVNQWGHQRTSGGLNYHERRFLEGGSDIHSRNSHYRTDTIPLNPVMSHAEKGRFIHEYMVEPSDDQQAKRARLIEQIKNNETITFTYNN